MTPRRASRCMWLKACREENVGRGRLRAAPMLFMDFSPCRASARHRKPPATRVEAKLRYATGHPPL